MAKSSSNSTKYKPDYCARLVKHMSEGYSFASFAGTLGVNRDTLYEWVKKYPDFKEAKAIGTEASKFFWEKIGINLATGLSKGNVISWIFNMKNRFPDEWKDKVEDPQEAEIVREVSVKYGKQIAQPGPRPDTIKKDSDGK